MGGSVEIIANAVPAEIMAKLVEDAEARDVTVQEAAVSILAARFKITRVPSFRPFIDVAYRNDTMVLSVPKSLRKAIKAYAHRREGTMRAVICSTIAEHYNLPPVHLGRRPRTGG